VKVRITVGEVDIRLDDLDVTLRQVRGLIKYAVGAATALAITGSDNDEPEQRAPIGFSAQVERLPEEIPQEDLSWYFDE
jgi:hypothetical protein